MATPEERLDELERRYAQMALTVQELTVGLSTQGTEKQILIQQLQDKFREMEELVAELQKTVRSRAESSIVDTRMLGKPKTFAGGQQGHAAWRDWSFTFRRYAGACHAAPPSRITYNVH